MYKKRTSTLFSYHILFSSPHRNIRTYFMHLHQHKGSRTALGLRSPIVHFALATGFLALQPGRFLDGNGVPHKPLSLSGRFQDIIHGVILPSSVHNIRKSKTTRRHHPTKVQPSWSSPTENKTVGGTVAASLISVSIGAALALGRSRAQGNSLSGEGDSGNNRSDDTINGDSGRNSLGNFHFSVSRLYLTLPLLQAKAPLQGITLMTHLARGTMLVGRISPSHAIVLMVNSFFQVVGWPRLQCRRFSSASPAPAHGMWHGR